MRAPAPSVPDLTPQNWIDLDQLGTDDLQTLIYYPGIASGDTFFPNWRGCTAAGDVQDIATARVDVISPGPDGEVFLIGNDVLRQLDQGWVFFSFFEAAPGNPNQRGEESLRIFFYVGKRDLPVGQAQLGVAQFRHSHERQIILDWIGTDSTTAVVTPPYQAMSVNDQVTLTVEFYFEGNLDDTSRTTKTLVAEELGRPLVWSVNKNALLMVEGGYVRVSYRIVYAQPTTPTDSPVQQLDVIRTLAGTLLPAPVIKDFDGGSLDPDASDGIVVQMPAWVGAQAGDVVVLYAAVEGQNLRVETLRLDPSSLDSGLLEVRLERAWLVANNGLDVALSWQHARAGASGSGEVLEVTVRKPLNLPSAIIEGVYAEDPVDGVPRGYLYADRYIANDVYVNIPEDADYGLNDQPQMHWAGHGSSGSVIITRPTVGNPRRFQVPSRAIPANMSKRLMVFYEVTPTPAGPVRSALFDLEIKPMSTGWPAIQLKEPVRSQPMKLSEVPGYGARFRLASWAWMAEGNQVRIVAEGLNLNSAAVSHVMRDDVPVNAEEYVAGELWALLPKAFLQGLKRNNTFTVKVQASFDDGGSWTPFKDVSIQLVD